MNRTTHALGNYVNYATEANQLIDEDRPFNVRGNNDIAIAQVKATLALASVLAAIREDLASIDAGIDALNTK